MGERGQHEDDAEQCGYGPGAVADEGAEAEGEQPEEGEVAAGPSGHGFLPA